MVTRTNSRGIRTPNLRINRLVEECWSERWMTLELVVCVSMHPIVSRRFPFLHGDETGTGLRLSLSFRSHIAPMSALVTGLVRTLEGPRGLALLGICDRL